MFNGPGFVRAEGRSYLLTPPPSQVRFEDPPGSPPAQPLAVPTLRSSLWLRGEPVPPEPFDAARAAEALLGASFGARCAVGAAAAGGERGGGHVEKREWGGGGGGDTFWGWGGTAVTRSLRSHQRPAGAAPLPRTPRSFRPPPATPAPRCPSGAPPQGERPPPSAPSPIHTQPGADAPFPFPSPSLFQTPGPEPGGTQLVGIPVLCETPWLPPLAAPPWGPPRPLPRPSGAVFVPYRKLQQWSAGS